MTDAGVNVVADPDGAGRDVTVGTYSLGVGPSVGMSISPVPEASDAAVAAQTQLARAIAQDGKDERKQRGAVDLVELSSDRAEEVTGQVERADTLWKEIAAGRLDIGAVNGEIDSLLALLQKLDRTGRFDQQLRLARALSRLLAVALRWLDLLRSLRETLAAAERHGDKSARAWALHELGTLHLAGDDLLGADRALSQAAELRKELGETRALAATERNLHVLCRTLRQRMRERHMVERGGLRRLLHAPLALIVALFFIVFGAATAAIAETGVFSGGGAPAAVVRTINQITPSSGQAAGGTVVTITGTRLEHAKAVRFGHNDGKHVKQLSGSRLQVTTPPGSGTVPVTVVTAHGDSAPSEAAHFKYLASPRPKVGHPHPDHGTQAGGTTTSPPASGGSTAGGNTGTVAAKPTISGITPPSGQAAGGTPVAIAGTGLESATAVTFDNTSVQFHHDGGDLDVTTPPGSGGVTVTVTTPAGVATGSFAYVPAPTITGIRPDKGQGGDSVVILGSGFATAQAVMFGGTAATEFQRAGDTSLLVAVPTDVPADDCNSQLQVTVTAAGGRSAPQPFTYVCPSAG